MAKRPHDFPDAVVKAIAARAGFACSNPDCHAATSGPHSNSEKSVSVGTAAHIEGYYPNTARYRSDWDLETFKAIDNAIWLCENCHKMVDRDETAYSSEELRTWRSWAEVDARLKIGRTATSVPPPAPKRDMEALIRDVVDAFSTNRGAKNVINDIPGLTLRERGDLWDAAMQRLGGPLSRLANPYKVFCDTCRRQHYGSDLTLQRVEVFWHFPHHPSGDHLVRDVRVCGECLDGKNWRNRELEVQQKMIERGGQSAKRRL